MCLDGTLGPVLNGVGSIQDLRWKTDMVISLRRALLLLNEPLGAEAYEGVIHSCNYIEEECGVQDCQLLSQFPANVLSDHLFIPSIV